MKTKIINLLGCSILAGLILAACEPDMEEKSLPFAIIVSDTMKNGRVEADKAEAKTGESVTLTATADEGYVLKEWIITGIELTSEEKTANPLEFVMPGMAVTVSAEFEQPFNVLDAITDEVFKAFVQERMSNPYRFTDPVTNSSKIIGQWDDGDGILTKAEAAKVEYIVLKDGFTSLATDENDRPLYRERPFSSLDGLEYFTGLKVLCLDETVSDPSGKTIDLSSFENLVHLQLSGYDCSLFSSTLVLGDKPDLVTLDLNGAQLYGVLDLSGASGLSYLDVSYCYFDTVDVRPIKDNACVILTSCDSYVILRKDQEQNFIDNNISDWCSEEDIKGSYEVRD